MCFKKKKLQEEIFVLRAENARLRYENESQKAQIEELLAEKSADAEKRVASAKKAAAARWNKQA